MGKYDTNLIDKMKADVEIPKVVDDKLEEVYEKICLGEVKMKQTKRGGRRKEDVLSDEICLLREDSQQGKYGRYMKYAVSAAVLLLVLMAGGGILYANPALAKDIPILRDVFGNLEKIRDEAPYPEKDKTAYEQIAEYAKPVEAKENEESITNIAEDEGISLTVSDVYCDGLELYFTLSARVEDEEMKKADFLYLMRYEEGDEIPFLGGQIYVEGTNVHSNVLTLKKAEEGVYVGLIRATSVGGGFKENNVVNVTVGGISAHRVPEKEGEEQVGYKMVDGDWKLRFDAKTDTSNNRIARPGVEQNGIIVEEVIQTPSNMRIKCYVKSQWARKALVFVVKDGNGNRVDVESGGAIESTEDGGEIYEISLAHSQADQFTVWVYDKNADPDESGYPPVIAEIPFRM